jgi:hypothetical protein
MPFVPTGKKAKRSEERRRKAEVRHRTATLPDAFAQLTAETIDWAMRDHPQREVTAKVFYGLCRFMNAWEVNGGCHVLSMMAYVLLREVGVDSTLNAGWARAPWGAFTHSWTELDGRPFDIAISRPNLHRRELRSPAVVYGVEVGSRNPTRITYGVPGPALDEETFRIATGTVSSWANRAPIPDWPWDRLVEVGAEMGLTLSREGLRAAHSKAPWRLRHPG